MRVRSWRIILIFSLLIVFFFTGFLRAEKITVKVNTQSAYVRLKASIDSMIILQVSFGVVLEASEQIGEWYKVALPPDEQGFVVDGYIHSTDIEVVAAKEAELQASPAVQKVRSKMLAAKEVEQVYRPTRESNIQFGLKFVGGGDYFLIGDLNDYLQGRQDYLGDDSKIIDVQGSYKPLKYGYSFGAEFLVDFTPHIGIGIGVGYFQVKKRNEVTTTFNYYQVGYPDLTYLIEWISPQINSIPLTFSLNLGLPLGSVVNLKFSGGIGYYLATVIWNYRNEWTSSENEMSWESKSNIVGYHGSLGLEYDLGRKIVFFIEGFGRYAKLTDLSGRLTVRTFRLGSENNQSYDSSFLKFLEYRSTYSDEWYPLVSIDMNGSVASQGANNVPGYTSRRKLRNAVIDLSGISLRIGFKIKF